MTQTFHELEELFRQLGLASDPATIEQFVAGHRPLPKDADWAEVVDALGEPLSA